MKLRKNKHTVQVTLLAQEYSNATSPRPTTSRNDTRKGIGWSGLSLPKIRLSNPFCLYFPDFSMDTCSPGLDLGQSVLGWWGRGSVPHGSTGKLSRWHSSPSCALSFSPLVACPPSFSIPTVSHLPRPCFPPPSTGIL